jgi:lipopolysaccharide/colanic/teichoic acid biosynthesis glycosyltransferase
MRIDGKRIFDVVLAAPALAALCPVMLLIAAAVRITSPGGAIYKGLRIGRFGRPFRLVKFRTMRLGADASGPLVTGSGDPRVTSCGRFLRRTKLDELPSLWNVVKGDMSLVGPRPENEKAVALYTPQQREILNLRPGITSLATLKYRNEEALLAAGPALEEMYYRIMQDKLTLELTYLRKRSFALDLKILFQTVLALFR